MDREIKLGRSARDSLQASLRSAIDCTAHLLEARERTKGDEHQRADLFDAAEAAQTLAHRVARLEQRSGVELPRGDADVSAAA